MTGLLENAPPYSTILKEVKQYTNEYTKEDTTMDIAAINSISKQCILTSSELNLSDWDGKVPTECYVKPQAVNSWNHYNLHGIFSREASIHCHLTPIKWHENVNCQ